MVTLIEQPDLEQIRRAIDIRLDSKTLPDGVIMLPIYVEAAEADVAQRDTALATRTGTDLDHAKRAAIYFCAARLAPAVPDITQQTFFDYKFTKSPRDIAGDVERLIGLAETELVSMSGFGGDMTVAYPVSHFGVAKATRGQW